RRRGRRVEGGAIGQGDDRVAGAVAGDRVEAEVAFGVDLAGDPGEAAAFDDAPFDPGRTVQRVLVDPFVLADDVDQVDGAAAGDVFERELADRVDFGRAEVDDVGRFGRFGRQAGDRVHAGGALFTAGVEVAAGDLHGAEVVQRFVRVAGRHFFGD